MFYNCFDQEDFLCRDTIQVIQGYLSDWFVCKYDKQYFLLPTVQIIARKTQFISGRHRTAVLIDHLNELPFAFAKPIRGNMTPILSIVDRPVDVDMDIELPDLSNLVLNL